MIPKTIWQTYEVSFEELLPEIKECIQTWINKNPSWEYSYMDSKSRSKFVLEHFGEEWHNIFNSCKLGIVKANIWRCMVLYIYGGIYCDLDTICNKNIESWIKNDYDMVISRDDDGNPDEYCINLFASKPNSLALKNILDHIKNNIINNEITIDKVIQLTGETAWYDIINNNENTYNIYCYEKGSNIFNGVAVKHLGTSKDWHNDGYLQWTRG